LDDLDKIEFASTPDAVGSSPVMPSTGLRQTALLWMMLGLGGVAIVFGLAYPALRPHIRGGAPASQEGDLKRERQRLLLVLARLDQAYQAGDLNETVYRRARTRHKAELAGVWRRLQEEEL
jgi:hypothetical protein